VITTANIMNADKLRIILDSQLFEDQSILHEAGTDTFLSFARHSLFEFIRSPMGNEVEDLSPIPAYEYTTNQEGTSDGVRVTFEKSAEISAFSIPYSNSEDRGKRIFNKETLNQNMLKELEIIFAVDALTPRHSKSVLLDLPSKAGLFVTKRHRILQNRKKIEGEFYGKRINCVTLSEAKEIMDLFLKYRGLYYLGPIHTVNKGSFYSLSFDSRFPRLKLSDPTLLAFYRRFIFLLMTVDEIGFQFFSGANDDTMASIVYYFNYFIALVTGIFDSLANFANRDLNINYQAGPKISINPSAGKDFLSEIKKKVPSLNELIYHDIYMPLIQLIYEFREEIIHRDLLDEIGFHISRAGSFEWGVNFLQIDHPVKQYIQQAGDRPRKYSIVSHWGVYKTDLDRDFLEPYTFVKVATERLVEFTNEFFKHIPESIVTTSRTSQQIKLIEEFRRTKLGF
jgi:hypothetical protein